MSALVICHSKHNSQIISNGKTLLGCLCTDLQRHMFGNSAQKSKCDHRTRANTLTTSTDYTADRLETIALRLQR